MMLHPRIPVWPPASRFFLRCFKPAFRDGYQLIVHPVAALVAGGGIDDAGNMTACGQHKSRISANQVLRTKRRLPWHDVVLAGREQINRYRYLRQVNRQMMLGIDGDLHVLADNTGAREGEHACPCGGAGMPLPQLQYERG